ncbi:MAG: YIEGIA domain-containing protein [Romboutsia sp.]
MKESVLDVDLFRRSFIVASIIGILCRGLVLRISDKQYPSRPQDYLEQIIVSGLSASLGAIALPALMDKEFSALTFFAVAIQQFQGLAQQERITLENIDNAELVQKGSAYVEEIASTYESRSYISLFSALAASGAYIIVANKFKMRLIPCTIAAAIAGTIVGLIFRKGLHRYSIGDVADIVPAKIHFDGPLLKVNDVLITNIGLEDTRKKYLENALAIEIVPKSLGDFGIINYLGQREAIIYNMFIHLGVDKDLDEKDIVTISKTDLNKYTVVIPYMPIIKDIDAMIEAAKSTPIIESAKGKQSIYRKVKN